MRNTFFVLLVAFFISPFSVAEIDEREQAFALILEWVQQHSGHLPRYKDFARGPGKIPLNYRRLMAIGDFAPGARQEHLALFADPQEFWLKFYRYALDKGVCVKMLDLCLKAPPCEELQAILQNEALDRIIEWMIETGRPPRATDFRSNGGTLDLDYDRTLGLGIYKDASTKVFPSKESYGQALKARWNKHAREQSASTHCVPEFASLKRSSEQHAALVAVLEWFQQNGRLPSSMDMKFRNFPFSYQKLVGHNAADQRKEKPLQSIFSTPEEFWFALKDYALDQGIDIYLLDVSFVQPSVKLKEVLRHEANTLVLRWIQDHYGRLPKAMDFGRDTGQIPIRYARLTAGSTYGPNGQARHLALFQDDQDFWRQFKTFAQQSGVRVSLRDVKFRSPLQEETRQLLEEEELSSCTSLIK